MFKKFKISTIVLVFMMLAPLSVGAAMQSSNYVIYENVMHTFDGPVISAVNDSVSGTAATITWTTNVIADSFVIYDTNNTFSTSKEQGTSVKDATNHSVIVSGLAENTVYYYKVRSTRVNGGMTVDQTVRSFTSGADTTVPAPTTGGGGLLIIDKTDKIAPTISNLTVKNITDKGAEISWDTDEEATSFIEYGQTLTYGSSQGAWSAATAHNVSLNNLEPSTVYHIRALSSDGWGNIGRSEDRVITTNAAVPGEETAVSQPANITTQTVIDFVRKIFPIITPAQLAPNPLTKINNAADLTRLIPSPILSGEPRVEIGDTEAKIYWTTDIDSTSQVAIAPDDNYQPNLNEPYQQIIGDTENLTRNHQVNVYGLLPDTVYHYQLRSKATMGPMSVSPDYDFRTGIEALKITSFFSQIIDQQTATFKWVTNKEADTSIKIAPYHGNIIAVDESKIYKDKAIAIIHEIKAFDLVGGIIYNVVLSSVDAEGNIATEVLNHFSTAEDDLPPEISRIKADSTVFLDQGNKTQTIISWMTNEPSTSRIYYQEGVQTAEAEFSESTNLNMNYTKEHVTVINKFKPGIVYSFRVESIDSGDNISLSNVHTFMTAKKKESIIQIIMRILEETFSWVNKLK